MKLFKLTIMAIIAVVLTFTYSCQQESLIEQDYSDMPYLSLPESTDFDNLSQSEMQTIMDAFERMGIHEDSDGLLQLKPRSGWEVNVSEEIFEFFKRMTDNTNAQITAGVTLSRSGQLNESENPGAYQTDCLARSISAALGSNSSSDIDAWIRYKYGNDGVPPENVIDVLNYFFNGRVATINPSQIPNNSVLGNKFIVIIDEAHAVNGYGISNGWITCRDYQQGGAYVTYSSDRISQMYMYY